LTAQKGLKALLKSSVVTPSCGSGALQKSSAAVGVAPVGAVVYPRNVGLISGITLTHQQQWRQQRDQPRHARHGVLPEAQTA
jgi:hypothetical protein